jgi:hypothetical protein
LISSRLPIVRRATIFCFYRDASFWCVTIFLFSSRLLIVRRATIVSFHLDAYLLKQHDIFDFTAMPSSFDASRYFIISTNSFWTQRSNTLLSCGRT